ncbi:probable LRR receptor-like serine/threonine-protein kinase at3g47570 [Phtheirospermum japonicum]|uniref:non-specific serine/threonine protein kinase n=1 Tax=Phtheirospermum japonicum TaxID=374723 RepID=A0A830B7S5_9LAMI|nr:probable LRR receptor-like serine/threonine-protein kinase at3g47570 [Phtheirospermum japonicum]
MGVNSFTGEIPSWFGALPQLQILGLRNNTFSGTIPPSLFNSSKLQILSLRFNSLNGSIPEEIGNCSSLQILNLNYNRLTGPIPHDIRKCRELEVMTLSYNHFNGEIPSEIGSLSMQILSLYNNSLSGPIPSSIFNISTLKNLELSYNPFSGSLPLKFSLPNLEELLLHNTELSGEIPSSITNASKLTLLELSKNSFSGSVPNFGNLRFLQTLRIWGNNLSGVESELGFLSSLVDCRSLEILEISGNPLNGILPASIGNLSTSLRDFYARDCNITGVIPNTIGNLSSLLRLALRGNQLTGPIPQTIGKLKKLEGLELSRNRLHGYIPPDLCRLSSMVELYLSDNILTGHVPGCLGDIKSLRYIYLSSNKLDSVIPSNFWNLRDLLFLNLSSNYLSGQLSSQIASFKAIYQLDLSHNQLSGEIPNSIDGCQSLGYLFLSNNNLEGSIPPSLGNIRGLTTLDLSNNSLSGSIPESLEGLVFLQYFNVSYNKLEGEIPARGPFINFTAQTFLNNSALCGEHRFQVPTCIKKGMTKSRQNKGVQLMKYILPPFISVIILAIIIVIVLIRRRKLKRVQAPIDIALGFNWIIVSYIELARGTNAFSAANLLGRGSFGSVFKATLSNGFDVAVKVFNFQSERAVRSFDTECEILSNIRHRNLVRIIGCCSNTEFKALILGYMPNGSLEKWLHSGNHCLDLIQRLQIAIDVALALEYLHHGHPFPVVHCDIKPGNVLLDDDMVAHLGDFGISKLFVDGEIMVQTKTLATIGYAAPEYGSEGKVSTNGDVYSYGILLLEIFTVKKPADDMFSEQMSLKEWVHKALQDNAVSEVAAPGLLTREENQHIFAKLEECVSAIFSLAMKCLAIAPDERINMIETVASLKRIKGTIVSGTTRRQQYALS